MTETKSPRSRLSSMQNELVPNVRRRSIDEGTEAVTSPQSVLSSLQDKVVPTVRRRSIDEGEDPGEGRTTAATTFAESGELRETMELGGSAAKEEIDEEDRPEDPFGAFVHDGSPENAPLTAVHTEKPAAVKPEEAEASQETAAEAVTPGKMSRKSSAEILPDSAAIEAVSPADWAMKAD